MLRNYGKSPATSASAATLGPASKDTEAIRKFLVQRLAERTPEQLSWQIEPPNRTCIITRADNSLARWKVLPVSIAAGHHIIACMIIAQYSPASARPVDVYVSARRSLKIQHVLGLKKTLCNIESALSCSRRLLLLTALSATGTLYRQRRPGHCISLDASTMAAAQQVMLTRQLQAQGVLTSTRCNHTNTFVTPNAASV